MRKIYTTLLILITLSSLAFAQENGGVDENLKKMSQSFLEKEHISDVELPPLSLLFENAKDNPLYKLSSAKIATAKGLLKKQRKDFLKFFSLSGSYKYGMFNDETNYTDYDTKPFMSYYDRAQILYTVGVNMNINLEQLFNLGRNNKQRKLTIKEAELEREVKFQELKKEIIQLYTMANSQINILKIKAEALILSQLQYEIAEKDFTNGVIGSSELSVEKERQSGAHEVFEKSKQELITSLMLLELITNTPILNR